MSWSRGHKLGHGSTATVYLATAHRSGEQFAVKSAELSQSEFLQREQGILSSIASPFVVGYRGCEITEENGEVFYNLMLDYMPGGTIVDEIRRRGGRMEESAIGSYTWQVLNALDYLHSNGIVHCDVKGRNILVGTGGRAVKLADFGCSKRVGSTAAAAIGGTPMFMAPETARGEEQEFAGDVWGLGCVVVEMATGGGSPWADTDGDDPVSAIYRVGYSNRVPEFPGWMSEQGKDFLDKCLRRDPKQRWTASQLLSHPFVAKFAGKAPSFDSPTSVLDNGYWNSVVPDESEEAPPSLCSSSSAEDEAEARERIGRLTMDASAGPSWEWGGDGDGDGDGDGWITARQNFAYEEGRTVVESCGDGEGDLLTESLESDYSVIRRSWGLSLEVECKYEIVDSSRVSCNLQSLIVSQA